MGVEAMTLGMVVMVEWDLFLTVCRMGKVEAEQMITVLPVRLVVVGGLLLEDIAAMNAAAVVEAPVLSVLLAVVEQGVGVGAHLQVELLFQRLETLIPSRGLVVQVA